MPSPCSALLSLLAGTLLALAACRSSAPSDAANAAHDPVRWIPDEFGVPRAIALVEDPERSPTLHTFTRRESPSQPFAAGTLGHLVGAIAGIESLMLDPEVRFECTGAQCLHVHGSITLGMALAQSCNQYFSALGRRLGSSALGATAASLGQSLPSIADDPAARALFVERGIPWTPSPEQLVALARVLASPPQWWPGALREALVLDDAVAGRELRAFVTNDEGQGWLVGFAPLQRQRVVVHVSGCGIDCGVRAIRIARWALRPELFDERTARDAAVEAGDRRMRRVRIEPRRPP